MLKRTQMKKDSEHKIVVKIIKRFQGIIVDNLKEI
jgi:hypothetical protein